MAIGVLGLLGLGLAGVGVGGWGSKKIDESIKAANNSELLFNKDDNVGSANEIVNKQTNPNNTTNVVTNAESGQLNQDGNVEGYSAIRADIEGDPDGGGLLAGATLDDSDIVKNASNQIEPHKDAITGMEFDNYDAFVEWKEKHPFIYGWRSKKPFQSGKWNPFWEKITPEDWYYKNPKGTKNYEWNDETQSFDEHYGQKVTKEDEHGNVVTTYRPEISNAEHNRKTKRSIAEKEYALKLRKMRVEAMNKAGKNLLDLAATRQAYQYEL